MLIQNVYCFKAVVSNERYSAGEALLKFCMNLENVIKCSVI